MGRPKKQKPVEPVEPEVTVAALQVPTLTEMESIQPIVIESPEPVGKRYDYKMLYATGAATYGTKWEEAFDKLGRDGYIFIGESAGRSVFVKSIG